MEYFVFVYYLYIATPEMMEEELAYTIEYTSYIECAKDRDLVLEMEDIQAQCQEVKQLKVPI